VRFEVACATTRLRLAIGRPKDSLVALEAITAELARGGCLSELLEARLLLGEIRAASGDVAGRQAIAAEVERVASERGLLWIASRARAAGA
jgi:hypothetical protein